MLAPVQKQQTQKTQQPQPPIQFRLKITTVPGTNSLPEPAPVQNLPKQKTTPTQKPTDVSVKPTDVSVKASIASKDSKKEEVAKKVVQPSVVSLEADVQSPNEKPVPESSSVVYLNTNVPVNEAKNPDSSNVLFEAKVPVNQANETELSSINLDDLATEMVEDNAPNVLVEASIETPTTASPVSSTEKAPKEPSISFNVNIPIPVNEAKDEKETTASKISLDVNVPVDNKPEEKKEENTNVLVDATIETTEPSSGVPPLAATSAAPDAPNVLLEANIETPEPAPVAPKVSVEANIETPEPAPVAPKVSVEASIQSQASSSGVSPLAATSAAPEVPKVSVEASIVSTEPAPVAPKVSVEASIQSPASSSGVSSVASSATVTPQPGTVTSQALVSPTISVEASIVSQASPAPLPTQAKPSIGSIGLRGTVYFYVNQTTKTPILVSGKISHTFSLTDTEKSHVADNSIQIKHDIDGAKLTTENPFNGKVYLDGVMNGNVYIGIGGNVYTVSNKDHKTIQVTNITPILPIPNSTIQSSPSYASFVQKYFEYSGKIYVDDWSSEIHWYTFYNPDNNMAPRDPTKHPAKTGGFDMGDWALEKRKINMSIGQITVESTPPGSSITITPPPFSIDMKKVVEGGGGNGKSGTLLHSQSTGNLSPQLTTNKPMLKSASLPKLNAGATNEVEKPSDEEIGADQLLQLSDNTKLDKKKLFDFFNDVIDILQFTQEQRKTKGDEPLPDEIITDTLANKFYLGENDKTYIKTTKIPLFIRNYINNGKVARSVLNNIISKLNNPVKPAPVNKDIAFSVQIDGTLYTATHIYHIHHTFYLYRQSTDVNIYTISSAEYDISNSKTKEYADLSTSELTIEGDIHVSKISDTIPEFKVDFKTPFAIKDIPSVKYEAKRVGKNLLYPYVIFDNIHIHKGKRQIDQIGVVDGNPTAISYVNINNKGPFSLHTYPPKTGAAKTNRESVICDLTFGLDFVQNMSKPFNPKRLYLNVISEAILPPIGVNEKRNKSNTEKGKPNRKLGGGHKTRRFRKNTQLGGTAQFTYETPYVVS